MTIHEITGNLQALRELCETGEYDEQTLADTMEAVEGEFSEKAESYAWVIRQMELDAEGMKKMSEEFARKQAILESGVKRIKERLLYMMEVAEIPEVKGEHFTLKVAKAGGVKPLILKEGMTPEELPQEFQKVRVEIDKTAIREALDAGWELDFARLGERGKYLKIK